MTLSFSFRDQTGNWHHIDDLPVQTETEWNRNHGCFDARITGCIVGGLALDRSQLVAWAGADAVIAAEARFSRDEDAS
jgi:hypothetical protein